MLSLSLFFPILNNAILVEDSNDNLGATDIVGSVEIEFINGQMQFTVPMAEVCVECTTEWRIGFRSLSSENNVPELVLSHTLTEVWWDENLNWQYPVHSSTPTGIGDQSWVTFMETGVRYDIQLTDLPKRLWFGFDIAVYTFDDDNNDWLGEGWSDDLLLDEDGDLLNSLEETHLGTAANDADSDDDGLYDGLEFLAGTDPTLCDTDGDGLSDGLENGITTRTTDTRTDTECFVGDRQPSTTTDPLLSDSDGGGLDDGLEDRDQDGLIGPWETDPTDPSDDLDIDNDGILDAIEERCPNGYSDDADGDGILDTIEGWIDTDEDGTPNFCDEDDDNDGLSSLLEGFDDWDSDGIPNAYDTDSDDDGILDADESIHDIDCDDNPSWLDDNPDDGPCADSDLDGLSNAEEETCGTDPFIADTDGDGILDANDCPNQDLEDWEHPNKESQGPQWTTGCGSASILCLLLLARRPRQHQTDAQS